MKTWFLGLILAILSLNIFGQNCTILSKANNITPDKLCSPVTATWKVTYTGVNDAGTPVSIRYNWDNGVVITVPATQIGPGIFEATAANTYTSAGNRCNYHPQATLVVNGVICSSSTQEQIVTVWDDDDHNGGRMHINPLIWPICFGNSANVRFQDLTLFNCVPPQERDNPNVNTRWIQWIYGTDITMTGVPITIGGRNRTFPFIDNVITLPGPVTGSGVWSDVINVANDKQIGEYFQVTLRNWNYCNPYDDPTIPGGPRDKENGDHPPVVTTAIILIVPYPDATITPVSPMCENDIPIVLSAATPGGTWRGDGMNGSTFSPSVAGAGNHIIQYDVTNSSGCTDRDTITILVKPNPDAIIAPIGVTCETDPPFMLIAIDTGGVWSGTGVIGNMFHPAIAGNGNHFITYNISWDGCDNFDQQIITVATPDATVNPIDTLCVDDPAIILTAHDLNGTWSGPGVVGNAFYPRLAGIGDHLISYTLNNPQCNDSDSTIITVMPIPIITIQPVGITFINGPLITLQATPTGGVWSGSGVTNSIFNPNIAGVGVHTITYEMLPDRWGCAAKDTIQITVIMPPKPIADFEPDTVGCAVLTVPFINNSLYGETYIWDFGDETYSNERDPIHTYYFPGAYIVKLTVINVAGTSIHNGIIQVYQNPIAIIDAYPTTVINNEQIVIFYNHSHYAQTYLWEFGDREISTEENPYHKYLNPGTYLVTLTVTSENGCTDSTTFNTPIIVDWKTGVIKFPNAFKWNETGPTGGIWKDGVYPEMDFVFRPFFENIIEYYLQIYNRWGTLIYESNDLYRGWDGYTKDGRLSPQGVYVWKANGRFADGKYFNEVGDVTFLH
jgi:PKD repeat protein